MGVKQVNRDEARHPGSKTSVCKGPEVRKSLAFAGEMGRGQRGQSR